MVQDKASVGAGSACEPARRPDAHCASHAPLSAPRCLWQSAIQRPVRVAGVALRAVHNDCIWGSTFERRRALAKTVQDWPTPSRSTTAA